MEEIQNLTVIELKSKEKRKQGNKGEKNIKEK